MRNKYLKSVNFGKDCIKNHWCPEWFSSYSEKGELTSNSQGEYLASHIPVVLVSFLWKKIQLYCRLWILWHDTIMYHIASTPFPEVISVENVLIYISFIEIFFSYNAFDILSLWIWKQQDSLKGVVSYFWLHIWLLLVVSAQNLLFFPSSIF